MINRANVYLSARFGHGQNNLTEAELERLDYLDKYGGNPSTTGTDHPPRTSRSGQRQVGDRDRLGRATPAIPSRPRFVLAHGDHRCTGVRSRLEAGLRTRIGAQTAPWSEKQVRGHFDRLRRDGLITAERDTANGPWRFAAAGGHCRCLFALRRSPDCRTTCLRKRGGVANDQEKQACPV